MNDTLIITYPKCRVFFGQIWICSDKQILIIFFNKDTASLLSFAPASLQFPSIHIIEFILDCSDSFVHIGCL